MTLGSLFDGYYAISDDGRLYSVRSKKFLRPGTDKDGYIYYVISINGKRTTAKAHRLVASAFIPNPEGKPTVDHKNGKRNDNRVENLQWASYKEQASNSHTKANMMAIAQKTDYAAMGAIRNFGRKRVSVYSGGQLIGAYESLRIAAQEHNANYSSASECANRKRKAVGGVVFVYVR